MPTITLLRHGQASFGAADYDALSATGRTQASVAGTTLAGRGLRDPVVVSGSLRRQRDTAALAAAAMRVHHLPPVDARWDEYDHIGLVSQAAGATGAPPDPVTFQVVLDTALHDWIVADDTTGWQAFAGGARAALHDLAAGLDGRDAVVATSGGVIAAICGQLLQLPPAGVVALNRVHVNAALTTLVVGRSGISLLTFNDHAHLSGATASLRTYR